jgi:hypothetical protein
VGLERGPFSLVRITEELLERRNSGSSLGRQDYRPWGSVALPMRQKLSLTSPKSGDSSVGIVRLRTKSHGVRFEVFTAVAMKNGVF